MSEQKNSAETINVHYRCLDIPHRRCNFCEFVFKTPPKPPKRISFSCFVGKFENEKRKRNSFFVRKFENAKRKDGIYTDLGRRRVDGVQHKLIQRCAPVVSRDVKQNIRRLHGELSLPLRRLLDYCTAVVFVCRWLTSCPDWIFR